MIEKINEIMNQIEMEPNSGCWLWTGKGHKFGYGQICYLGKKVEVHRFMYMASNGPIKKGLVIRHRCNVPECCNPDHLVAGTVRDNILDMVMAGRSLNQKKTHCAKGHEYTEENTIRDSKNRRICRKCRAVWSNKNYILNKDKINTRSKKWREENRERSDRKSSEWYFKNREERSEERRVGKEC